jgi:hypothetical protein
MAINQKQKPEQTKKRRTQPRTTGPVNQAPLALLEEAKRGTLQRAVAVPALATPADILALQRHHGNRSVQQLLAPLQAKQEGIVQAKPALKSTVAAALCVAKGSADAKDKKAVAKELMKFPKDALLILQKKKTKIAVCRNSVTEVATHLKGVRPRGWPAGMTWDKVPGLYDGTKNQVIIATKGGKVPAKGDGHGAANLVVHEVGHALDAAIGGSDTQAFKNARAADLVGLTAYEKQAGKAGREETFAESMARYYGKARGARKAHPKLHAFWKKFKWKEELKKLK